MSVDQGLYGFGSHRRVAIGAAAACVSTYDSASVHVSGSIGIEKTSKPSFVYPMYARFFPSGEGSGMYAPERTFVTWKILSVAISHAYRFMIPVRSEWK